MYVNWKTLIAMGLAFWGLLCASDYFFEDFGQRHYDLGIYHTISALLLFMHRPNLSEDWFSEADQLKEQEEQKEPISFLSLIWSLIFWNFVAFVTTIGFCCAGVNCMLFGWKVYLEKNRYTLKCIIVESSRKKTL